MGVWSNIGSDTMAGGGSLQLAVADIKQVVVKVVGIRREERYKST